MPYHEIFKQHIGDILRNLTSNMVSQYIDNRLCGVSGLAVRVSDS